MERWSNKWFKEGKTEKMDPARYRWKSLEWSGAEDQNSCRVVVSEEEDTEMLILIPILSLLNRLR